MKNRLSGILAAALIISATSAFGAVKEGQFSISPVIGGYTFEGAKQHLDTTLVYGARAGYNLTKAFGVEALFDYAYAKSNKNQGKADMYRYGGELLYHFMPDNNLVPYVAAGFSGLNFYGANINKKTHGAFDYGAGLKYFVTDNFALRADVRHIIYSFDKKTYNNLEYTLGAHIPFGADAPAVQPVSAPALPAPAKVVAPPPLAPMAILSVTPAAIVKSVDSWAALSWTSSNADKCSIQPGIGSVEINGSRSVSPSENTVYKLTCSGAGGEATSGATLRVTQPVVETPVIESPKKVEMAQRFCNKPAIVTVLFDLNKADIKTKYNTDLNNLGEFLKEFPGAKGEISGHTDNVGTEKYNLELSEKRAENVEKYLEKNFGLVPDRVTTKGYGESKPIASNKTKEDRSKNRRIETNFSCQ